jgi:hypothetical protein
VSLFTAAVASKKGVVRMAELERDTAQVLPRQVAYVAHHPLTIPAEWETLLAASLVSVAFKERHACHITTGVAAQIGAHPSLFRQPMTGPVTLTHNPFGGLTDDLAEFFVP